MPDELLSESDSADASSEEPKVGVRAESADDTLQVVDGPDLLEDEEDDEDEDEESDVAVEFRWKQGRDNILSPAGLRDFQLAYKHKDEEYETARKAIDEALNLLSPRLKKKGPATRHGGMFSTKINFLEEMGLMYREEKDGKLFLRATPAGDQAALLLSALPETLRVVPYFLTDLLTRYRFNNPLNKNPKNQPLGQATAESDIFPYWSLYKIFRGVGNTLTKDEMARFVMKAKMMADVDQLIQKIKTYRADKAAGMTNSDIEEKYGVPLPGTFGQSKYIIGRAGFQAGVIRQDGDEYSLNPDYVPFIDELLKQEPQFEELDEASWIRKYGDPVRATQLKYRSFDPDLSDEPLKGEINSTDLKYIEVRRLFDEDEFSGVLLIGPPGTGKTWYARQIGILMTGGVRSRLKEVQFHPAYQYEDFVEGYVPDGRGGFTLVNKQLLQMCLLAAASANAHVLIIDELSRTDPARVMGEAMTYMESSLRGTSFFLPSGRSALIPKNLFFIGTMNPEDRSVDEIDAAMDRRWGKVYLEPDPAVINTFLTKNGLNRETRSEVIKFFTWIQARYKLGHAYFRTVKDIEGLDRLWKNQLYFLFGKAFRYDEATLAEIDQQWQAMMTAVRKIVAQPAL